MNFEVLDDFNGLEMGFISNNSGGYISKNKYLFEKIEEKFDVIVSNPPYIETKTIQTLDKEVQMEPKLALDGGEDGLDLYRRIIKEAYKYLNNNGTLALEIGYNQKDKVINLLKASNMYKDIYSKKDLSNNDRIVVCKKRSN